MRVSGVPASSRRSIRWERSAWSTHWPAVTFAGTGGESDPLQQAMDQRLGCRGRARNGTHPRRAQASPQARRSGSRIRTPPTARPATGSSSGSCARRLRGIGSTLPSPRASRGQASEWPSAHQRARQAASPLRPTRECARIPPVIGTRPGSSTVLPEGLAARLATAAEAPLESQARPLDLLLRALRSTW